MMDESTAFRGTVTIGVFALFLASVTFTAEKPIDGAQYRAAEAPDPLRRGCGSGSRRERGAYRDEIRNERASKMPGRKTPCHVPRISAERY